MYLCKLACQGMVPYVIVPMRANLSGISLNLLLYFILFELVRRIQCQPAGVHVFSNLPFSLKVVSFAVVCNANGQHCPASACMLQADQIDEIAL